MLRTKLEIPSKLILASQNWKLRDHYSDPSKKILASLSTVRMPEKVQLKLIDEFKVAYA